MTTKDIQLQGQIVEMLKVESLMGLDFLEKNNCVVDLSEKILQFKGVQVSSGSRGGGAPIQLT